MNVKIDSKLVVPGDTFIAIKGNKYDGHDFINEAIKNGASKVIAEKGTYEIETEIVSDTKEYLNNYLKQNYGDKISSLKLIGMTGTNGKTTTCYLIYQALNKLNIKTAYIGTIGFYMENKVFDLNNTTPSILDIYNMLLKCAGENYKYVVMEVSSHALDMGRVDILNFDYTIFSNLTRDHLDYHQTMENYALAKQKLFYKLKDSGKAIINVDDDYKDKFLIETNNNITYGVKESDYQITNIKMNMSESYFEIKHNGIVESYKTKLLGEYNIYNLLAVLIILNDLGINPNEIKNIILSLHAPIGRMDMIKYNNNLIVIDYAHTPDAVSKIINCVKDLSIDNIYTIIGCGGNRDKIKRKQMAEIATLLSTKAVFTTDNPRNEDPNDIIKDMINELKNDNYEVILDRKTAIKKGIQMLKNNDILLVLGKGHETYQEINNVKYPFDDKKVILDIIRR